MEAPYPFGLRLSPDSRTLMVPLFTSEVFSSWQLSPDGAEPVPLELTLPGPTLPIAQFAFTPDGRLLVGGGCAEGSLSSSEGACNQGGVWVWNAASGELVGSPILGHGTPIVRVAVSGDGERLASIGFDERARVWQAGIGEQLAEFAVSLIGGDLLGAIALTPDGTALLLGDRRGLHLWSLDEDGPSERDTPTPISGLGMQAVAFSPDGRRAAAGGVGGELVVWEVASGALLLHNVQAHDPAGGVTALAFSPDGSRLASGGGSGRLVVHDLTGLAGQTDGAEALTLLERACAIANRNLSELEWQQYFGAEPYRASCPDLVVTTSE